MVATVFAVLITLFPQSTPHPQQPGKETPAPAAGQQPLDRLPPRQARAEPAQGGAAEPDRAWIGVTLQAEALQPEGPEGSESERPPGLSVVQVLPGSPAAKAGLEDGDRIVAVEGKPLGSYDSLASLLREHVPGNRLRLEVRREVSVSPERRDSGSPRLGVVLEAAEPGRGVEVAEVVAGSPAARAGLRERDRVLSVAGREVSTREDVVAALEETASSRAIQLELAREIEVTLGRMPPGLGARAEEGTFGLPGLAPLPELQGPERWPYQPLPGMGNDLEELKSELRSLSEEVRSLRALIEELRAEVSRLRR